MSLSSNIVSGITAFRNPNGPEQKWAKALLRNGANPLKVLAAEVGYAIAIPFAIIETALSLIAKIFSACLPIGQENHDKMTEWLKSSAFSVAWSTGDALINICCNDMIQTERVARACAASGNPFRVPVKVL